VRRREHLCRQRLHEQVKRRSSRELRGMQ
jgi:hypothetical protein